MDIKEIAKEYTREDFLEKVILGRIGCPHNFGLKKSEGNCKEQCLKCWENAVKDIKFKGDVEMKQYKGWEIIKLISENKIKQGTKIIKHYDSDFTDDKVFVVGENTLDREDGRTDISCSYLSNKGYFTIKEVPQVSFMEAIEEGSKDKKIKVVMNRSAFPTCFADALNEYMTLNEIFKYMSKHLSGIGIKNVIKEGKWYIEEE